MEDLFNLTIEGHHALHAEAVVRSSKGPLAIQQAGNSPRTSIDGFQLPFLPATRQDSMAQFLGREETWNQEDLDRSVQRGIL